MTSSSYASASIRLPQPDLMIKLCIASPGPMSPNVLTADSPCFRRAAWRGVEGAAIEVFESV